MGKVGFLATAMIAALTHGTAAKLVMLMQDGGIGAFTPFATRLPVNTSVPLPVQHRDPTPPAECTMLGRLRLPVPHRDPTHRMIVQYHGD